MTSSVIVGLFVLGVAGWFVWDSLKVREAANAAMRAACASDGLLFLDDTVGLQSIRPVRGDDGRMRLRRIYAFEYSDTGHNRRKGSIALIGDKVEVVDIGVLTLPRQGAPH
jgi:hypothetical protein